MQFSTEHSPHGRQRFLHVILVAALTIAGAATAVGQESRGTISGRVVDSSGGVLPGVTVTVVNTGTNATNTVVTGDGGQFSAPLLISGTYRVTVELNGFRTVVRESVEVRVGDRLQVDFTLEPASVSTRDPGDRPGAAARHWHRDDGPGDRQQADWRDAARRRHGLWPGAARARRLVRTLLCACSGRWTTTTCAASPSAAPSTASSPSTAPATSCRVRESAFSRRPTRFRNSRSRPLSTTRRSATPALATSTSRSRAAPTSGTAPARSTTATTRDRRSSLRRSGSAPA